jgi:hypothetical protein
VGVVANGLPEDVALIVAEVDAVNVRTGIFTLHVVALSLGVKRKDGKKKGDIVCYVFHRFFKFSCKVTQYLLIIRIFAGNNH